MDVVSACPLRVSSFVWQARPGTWVLTIVCKATYRIEQNASQLAAEQEHPNDDDNHWDDDPAKSVYAPGDLAPFKTRAEVLLVGNAFSPGGQLGSSLKARLRVGEIDKSIAVYGDRSWTLDGRLREPASFARMSLRYERAAGGPDTSNPVGVRPDVANAFGEVAVPNLWPVDRSPQQRGEIVPPVGFGPIAATWPARRERLGPLARSFSLRDLTRAALPLEIDPSFFSSAPRDQQLAELHRDETILLENLHPRHPRLSTRLPGIAPRAFVERRTTAPQEVPLRADTLWIDTDRSLATMVWRAQVSLAAADEPGRVLVGMELPGQHLTWSDVVKLASSHGTARGPSPEQVDEAESLSEDDVRETTESIVAMTADAHSKHSESEASSTLFLMEAPLAAQTLPFAAGQVAGSLDSMRKAEQAAAAVRGQDLPVGWAPPSPFAADAPMPVVPDGPPTAFLSPFSLQGGEAAHTIAAPYVATPGPITTPAPVATPSLGAAAPVAPAPPPMLSRPALYDAPDSPSPRPEPIREVAVSDVLARATDAGHGAARLGVLGLSDAAAGAHESLRREDEEAAADRSTERPEAPRSRPSEILKLLWFDPRVVPRLHRHPEWRILLAEMELRLLDEPEDEGSGEADNKARRSVFEVLSRGLPSPQDSLRRTLSEAIDDRGSFEPPLVLLSGELEFPFDEVESLKAAVTILTPLAPSDPKLKSTLEAAADFLKTPGADQFTQLAQSLTDRLREAFSQMRRALPADHVDSHTERALLRQRAYSMKTLYGKRWIRALLRGSTVSGSRGSGGDGNARGDSPGRGASSDTAPPVYLPEALKDELPAYRRVRVKALGEVDLQEDQEESATWVVKITALARVISGL